MNAHDTPAITSIVISARNSSSNLHRKRVLAMHSSADIVTSAIRLWNNVQVKLIPMASKTAEHQKILVKNFLIRSEKSRDIFSKNLWITVHSINKITLFIHTFKAGMTAILKMVLSPKSKWYSKFTSRRGSRSEVYVGWIEKQSLGECSSCLLEQFKVSFFNNLYLKIPY